MSTNPKPRGGSSSELTKLKLLWRDSLSDSARDYWRALFISATTQAEIRKTIATKLKVELKRDSQLTEFRSWLEDQDARDVEAQRQFEDEQRLKSQFGDSMSPEEIRQRVLQAAYARAMAKGDFKLGLQAMDRDLTSQKVSIDREKLVLMKRKADAYDRAQAALNEAKNSKGGITPDTLKKIETELRLL